MPVTLNTNRFNTAHLNTASPDTVCSRPTHLNLITKSLHIYTYKWMLNLVFNGRTACYIKLVQTHTLWLALFEYSYCERSLFMSSSGRPVWPTCLWTAPVPPSFRPTTAPSAPPPAGPCPAPRAAPSWTTARRRGRSCWCLVSHVQLLASFIHLSFNNLVTGPFSGLCFLSQRLCWVRSLGISP